MSNRRDNESIDFCNKPIHDHDLYQITDSKVPTHTTFFYSTECSSSEQTNPVFPFSLHLH